MIHALCVLFLSLSLKSLFHCYSFCESLDGISFFLPNQHRFYIYILYQLLEVYWFAVVSKAYYHISSSFLFSVFYNVVVAVVVGIHSGSRRLATVPWNFRVSTIHKPFWCGFLKHLTSQHTTRSMWEKRVRKTTTRTMKQYRTTYTCIKPNKSGKQ